MNGFTSDRRLYVTADKERVVEEGDPEAAFLLVGAGSSVDPEIARKYSLDRVLSKAVKGPAQDKAVKPPMPIILGRTPKEGKETQSK